MLDSCRLDSNCFFSKFPDALNVFVIFMKVVRESLVRHLRALVVVVRIVFRGLRLHVQLVERELGEKKTKVDDHAEKPKGADELEPIDVSEDDYGKCEIRERGDGVERELDAEPRNAVKGQGDYAKHVTDEEDGQK